MTSTCEMESCPNWSGDGEVCPCAVFDLGRPARPRSYCEGDYRPPGSDHADVCFATLNARGECTRTGGWHDPDTGLWVRHGETAEDAVAAALRGDQPEAGS